MPCKFVFKAGVGTALAIPLSCCDEAVASKFVYRSLHCALGTVKVSGDRRDGRPTYTVLVSPVFKVSVYDDGTVCYPFVLE